MAHHCFPNHYCSLDRLSRMDRVTNGLERPFQSVASRGLFSYVDYFDYTLRAEAVGRIKTMN